MFEGEEAGPMGREQVGVAGASTEAIVTLYISGCGERGGVVTSVDVIQLDSSP